MHGTTVKIIGIVT